MHFSVKIDAMNAEIDLRRLRHLVLLDEELSFTRAAERANLSQTAFSRSVQALEAEFGVRVFDRDTRTVRVTAAGRRVLERARDLLARARDLAHEIDGIAHAEGGELSLGASLMAIEGVLGGVLPALRQLSPALTLRVEVGQWQLLQQHLEQERIELFVGYPGPLAQDPNFAVTPLAKQPASVFCRADHPLASVRHPALRQVPTYPWALIQLPDALAVRLRALFGVHPQAPLPVALSCDNQSLLREAMLTSDTLLFTWRSWLQDDIRAAKAIDLGERLRPALPGDLMSLECAIVQLAGRTASPGAQRLVALLTAGRLTPQRGSRGTRGANERRTPLGAVLRPKQP
ncbi:LysR family transcriptional regulator [Ideonella sp. DXS22W]|uniref:LysR family transcriptional regulator n=1 Tax=Pseudaquabacterium inlustre TaxID=2984192 RepID=A0ABU9CNJ4_9BURK